MELRHLRYFLAVAETGSITHAAARCFVAQSALSAQVARLEAEVGGDLFVRSSRGMTLTPAGEELLPKARRLLDDASRLLGDMAALHGIAKGHLRVGMIQGLPASMDVVHLVSRFHRAHPGVEVSVRTGASQELIHEVSEGALDVAIIGQRDDLPATLQVTSLADDPLVAVVPKHLPPPNAPASLRTIAALGPFIHYQQGSGLRASVNSAFERAGVEVDALFELDQIVDMVRLAEQGEGTTIVPSNAVSEETAATVVTLVDAEALHTVSVISSQRSSPATESFVALLAHR